MSWIRWTSRQFSCPEPVAENWEMSGTDLLTLSDKDFASRAPQVSDFLADLFHFTEDSKEFRIVTKLWYSKNMW